MARKVFPTKVTQDLIDRLTEMANKFGISRNQLAELILENGVTEIDTQMEKGQRTFRFLTLAPGGESMLVKKMDGQIGQIEEEPVKPCMD